VKRIGESEAPALFSSGEASRSAAWPAEQGGRKHGLTGIAISAKGWRFAWASVSLDPRLLSASSFASGVGIEGVVSNTTRSGRSRERAIGMEKHQFAANSAATRKLPTHPKYFNNGMVTVSAPICRLQFTATGFAEIAQRVHLVDQLGQIDECSVRGQIGFEDQPTCLLGRLNHGIARKDFHTGDESVKVDQFRNLRLVVDEGVGVKP
jgi:hypothetical protein